MNRRALILAAGAVSLVPARVAADQDAGVIEAAQGEAVVFGPPERALWPAASVFVGDEVVTGATGRLAMLLGGQTRVLMGEATRLTIDRFLVDSGGEFTLGDGAMIFDRPEDAPRTPVSVVSQFGQIAVRGTRFFAGPSRGVFAIFVFRGEVLVTAGGQELVLPVGFGTEIAVPGGPPDAPLQWGEGRIAEALASVAF